MIRSRSGSQAAGGAIPRCYGFRLRPRLLAGQSPGTGPWPVTLRHNGGDRQPDLQVFDSTFFFRGRAAPDGGAPLGPFVIDPDGALPAWGWDVQWLDEDREYLQPHDAGALTRETLYDSGVIAGGAAILSGVLDTSQYRRVLVVLDNTAGGAARNLSAFLYADDGTTTLYAAGPALGAGSRGIYPFGLSVTANNASSAFSALTNRAKFGMAAGGAANGRVVVFGER